MRFTTIFHNPKVKAKKTCAYLDSLPGDGVLVEGLIAYPIAYLTDKRVVVLSHDPDPNKAKNQVILAVNQFSLHYIVISDAWKSEEHLGYPAVPYVIENYKLLKEIEEDGDTYRIYRTRAFIRGYPDL